MSAFSDENNLFLSLPEKMTKFATGNDYRGSARPYGANANYTSYD